MAEQANNENGNTTTPNANNANNTNCQGGGPNNGTNQNQGNGTTLVDPNFAGATPDVQAVMGLVFEKTSKKRNHIAILRQQ